MACRWRTIACRKVSGAKEFNTSKGVTGHMVRLRQAPGEDKTAGSLRADDSWPGAAESFRSRREAKNSIVSPSRDTSCAVRSPSI